MHAQLSILLALASLTFCTPTPSSSSLLTRQNAGVLADTTFSAISIAGGLAGNAEAEAIAVFQDLDLQNPENISEADIEFLDNVNGVANDAEKEAFNVAIEASEGSEREALQAGKIKNKVLKLTATRIKLEAQIAQGQTDLQEKLDDELVKLNNNIQTDVESAGSVSSDVEFDGEITGGN